ncbi:hypothetical protein BDY21DRAFT_388293 [Lineolata rhizophorae]|uniref:EKC/KEOPS complex subunit BUD32 n=1 Tax=Lineolata rhizophorae TaxID=578093 RepID=A0A6A6NNL9_9PEZI|nr:hypothetical protein BDY21DRAFT_388293 [Lineolata rhizophorae]
MAALSDAEIIAQNPIGGQLDSFRRALQSTFDELRLSEVKDHRSLSARLVETTDAKFLAVDLVLTLQTTSLARTLLSRSGTGTLLRDLSGLVAHLDSPDFDTRSFIPLFEHVDGCASDQEICAALFTLLASLRSTPPTVFSKLPLDTPVKSNSSSQCADEQTHNDIDERILQEINGCVYRDTKEWSADADRMTKMANPQVRSGLWTEYPIVPSQDAFFSWFWAFQRRYLCRGRGTFYASPDLPLAGSDYVRKHTDELLKFTGHAREVFAAQPTRRFLHGFIIRGSIMELWVFDRSGLYGSEKFDIHKDPRRFIKIMFGYTRMSDEQLGVDTFIKEDKEGKYVVLEEEAKEEHVYLEDKPIAFQRAIVCRGTACYRARKRGSQQWQYVVKFAWRSNKRQAEGELLRLAKERNVWGVAKLINHRDLDAIADLRSGLQFGKPQIFRLARQNLISQSRTGTRSSMLANPLGISLTPLASSSSGQKRKRADEKAMAPPPKWSRSKSSRRSHTTGSSVQADGGVSSCVDDNPNLNSLTTTPEVGEHGSFENRIFSCLIISPPGRPLREFKSILEFLHVCLDVVKALRSLHCNGKILHRDISENNIIIAETKREEEPRAIVIDLDLGKELDRAPSGARHRTGTMEFMAIEVLRGKQHTYRHDVESFFYVIVWVIISHRPGGSQGLSKESQLRDWYRGSYTHIATIKRGQMDRGGFKDILAEFLPAFESLKGPVEELRDILFPYRGELFTGTYKDPDRLYHPMIKVFERAIAQHRGLGLG